MISRSISSIAIRSTLQICLIRARLKLFDLVSMRPGSLIENALIALPPGGLAHWRITRSGCLSGYRIVLA